MGKKHVETDANIADSAAQSGELEGAVKTRKARKPRVSMIAAWGETFARAVMEGLTQADVEQIMIERFPEKEPTVRKWTTWYKNFYNMGKIKGHESPAKVLWLNEKQVVNEEKKVQREAAKAEKLAAREETRRLKAEAKEAKSLAKANKEVAE